MYRLDHRVYADRPLLRSKLCILQIPGDCCSLGNFWQDPSTPKGLRSYLRTRRPPFAFLPKEPQSLCAVEPTVGLGNQKRRRNTKDADPCPRYPRTFSQPPPAKVTLWQSLTCYTAQFADKLRPKLVLGKIGHTNLYDPCPLGHLCSRHSRNHSFFTASFTFSGNR